MDDKFLHAARENPRPGFASELRSRLAAGDAARRSRTFPGRRVLRRVLGIALPIAAAVLALVLFPDMRAGAQAFLEMFRVRTFAAVNVDPSRLGALEKSFPDPRGIFGEVRVVHEAGAAQRFETPALAFAAAGFAPAEPAFLPAGLAADSAIVLDGQEFEVTLDARRLGELLASLDIRDVGIPPAYDGARMQARTSRRVGIRYRKDALEAVFMQSPNPQISLPPGLDRARLAEIGLRVIGLPADEARRFADRVDWNSTMLIPLPTGKATFRDVDVRGQRGLLIEAAEESAGGPARDPVPSERRPDRVLLWSNGERIFALGGNLRDYTLLEMANSVP